MWASGNMQTAGRTFRPAVPLSTAVLFLTG